MYPLKSHHFLYCIYVKIQRKVREKKRLENGVAYYSVEFKRLFFGADLCSASLQSEPTPSDPLRQKTGDLSTKISISNSAKGYKTLGRMWEHSSRRFLTRHVSPPQSCIHDDGLGHKGFAVRSIFCLPDSCTSSRGQTPVRYTAASLSMFPSVCLYVIIRTNSFYFYILDCPPSFS